MKKFISIIIIICILVSSLLVIINKFNVDIKYYLNLVIQYVQHIKSVKVPEEYSKEDRNENGIPDCLDIVAAARKEAVNKTKYVDAYYRGDILLIVKGFVQMLYGEDLKA